MKSSDLKKAGLKVTLPRIKILAMFEKAADRHLSAEDIYKMLLEENEDIALATIYRVLSQFEAAELVTRHNFESGQSVFELNNNPHHDHLVDIKTGKVVEFYDEIIENRQKHIAEKYGFTLTDHTMVLYGHFNKSGEVT